MNTLIVLILIGALATSILLYRAARVVQQDIAHVYEDDRPFTDTRTPLAAGEMDCESSLRISLD